MQSHMILIGLGAVLVVVGIALVAAQTLWAGRLSDARRPRSVVADASLEPRGRSGLFDIRAHWPGVALVAVGILLLITAAAF